MNSANNVLKMALVIRTNTNPAPNLVCTPGYFILDAQNDLAYIHSNASYQTPCFHSNRTGSIMPRKRVTMREVAELAGVSRTTVSFVLNRTPNVNIPQDTRKRIIEAARQLNYVPNAKAINLATGRTNTLAFVLR